ncbi:RHS repeat-associated core domain-containing protein [Tenacibaculum sp. 190524A02b]|uniref:RHS repeat-associated core domain-containing protein n=1 Tax=Tenacibaculum vairaonense TaxID=3137860 RepID=UPI0031FAEF4D
MVKIKNQQKREALKKWGASFLALLIFWGNVPATLANNYARESSISAALLAQNKKTGALPVKQLDLGTGNVTLHETLLGVEGYQASISYNSEGVAQKAITWNRSQKQGTLGLGWEYPENRIIRVTQQTGTTSDDSYLLYNQGATYPLLFIEKDKTQKTYRIAKKHNWIVKYHIANKQWRLFMEDGKINIYGDGALIKHKANSVEYNVKWGNWIGSSILTEKQELMPISYNLSAIEDVYGEQVKLFYTTTDEEVGKGGKKHTRASYLTKVEGLRGKTLNYQYKKKENHEYSDPHTENNISEGTNDQDAYQERYEDKHLISISLNNRKNQLIKKVSFDFKQLKKGTELQKRLLTAINYLDAKEDVYKPAKTFDYFGFNNQDGVHAGLTKAETKMYNPINGALYGAIKQENLPEGVSYAFQYSKQKIEGANKTLPITFPEDLHNERYDVSTKWSAPELFYGNDYVVAIFESQDLTLRKSYVKTYQWIGDRWNEQDLGVYDGYFYDRYFAKDQYTKGILARAKQALFDGLSKTPGGAALSGVINALNDGIKDEAKTFYRVGDDVKNGKVGKAVEDWFKGQAKMIKDVVLDIAAAFEKEAEAFKRSFDKIIGNKQTIFIDKQKELYEARQKDLAKNPRKQYHIALQKDFFALTTSYGGNELLIFQKNKIVPGTWTRSSERANISSKFFTFDASDNFIAILDEVTDFLYIYSWDGLVWNIDMTILKTDFNNTILNNNVKNDLENALDGLFSSSGENQENKLDHRSSIVAKNNMILAVITDSHGINADITIFHHDENMNWKHNAKQINKKAVSGNAFNIGSLHASMLSLLMGRDGKIDLKMGNSFAVLQTYDNLDANLPSAGDIPIFGNLIEGLTPDTKKINSTYGIVWDENFENIQIKHLHSAAGQTGVESFVVGDVINKIGKAHNLLVGSNDALAPSDGKNYAFRYNGKVFLSNQFISPYYTSGFANDVVSTIIESSDKAFKTPEFFQYDPNTAAWSKINNASQEKIAAPEFIDEAINVTVEVINIIVQIVTLVLPGIGEALEVAEETIQLIDNAANIVQVSTMVMEPVAKELVKDIMGTNHKSTSIANNYISVNGKLFHRNPSGTWTQVTNDEFLTNGTNAKLVGSTNNIVSNFIPYTLKTDNGIENHIKLLGNGKVYDTKIKTASNFTVHQDSITSTIGASAFVSYGPVNQSNGFVQKNSFTEQFKPVIGATADERARRNRPAYKDATQVILHKVVGLDLQDELYDYPVTKVTIKQNTTNLSAHHYIYDTKSAAYDANSHLTLYAKVTDIPTSKQLDFNTEIDLATTNGGYIEHYFYNRYNTYGETVQKGYPSKENNLKLRDPKLVTYQSIHKDDKQNFKNGNITTLYGHPYATLIYNNQQKVVSFDHTYYNVWEEDLRNPANGNNLQEHRIYLSRPVKKIQATDNVIHTNKMLYDFAKHTLVLRKTSKEGLGHNFGKEIHSQYHTYAFEHYDSLRKTNRIQEPFALINTVKQGNDPEKVTGADITAYESFKVNGNNIEAPKNFYKLANNKDNISKSLPANIIQLITTNVAEQARIAAEYETTVVNDYSTQLKSYNNADRAALDIQKLYNEQQGQLEQLHQELFALSDNLEYYKAAIIVDQNQLNAINTKVNALNNEKKKIVPEIEGLRFSINLLNIKLNDDLVKIQDFFTFFGKSIADVTREEIQKLNAELDQKLRRLQQITIDLQKEAENKTSLINDTNQLKSQVETIDNALKKAKEQYHTFNDFKKMHINNSRKAFNGGIHNFEKSKHQKISTDIHGKYLNHISNSASALNNITDNLTLPNNNNVNNPNYNPNFQNEIKNKVLEIGGKHLDAFNTTFNLTTFHTQAITSAERYINLFKNISTNYDINWIRTKTIDLRDSSTGIPIAWYDTLDKYHSVILHPLNKKPIASFNGTSTLNNNNNTLNASYLNFENPEQPELADLINHRIIGINNQGNTGKHSASMHPSALINATVHSNNKIQFFNPLNRYVVSGWIKSSNQNPADITFNAGHPNIEKIISVNGNEDWKYFEFIAPEKGHPSTFMHITHTKGIPLFDDILIRPLGTIVKLKTWDDNDNLSHEITNSGLRITHIYDDAQQHIASIDNTGKMMDYTHHGYTKLHNNGTYNHNAPNKNVKIHFQENVRFYKNSSDTTINANELGDNFAISFTADQSFSLTKGNQKIEKNGNTLANKNVSKHKNFLILTQNNELVVYDGAKQITKVPYQNGDLRIQGNLRNLIVGKKPAVKVTFKDGLARNIQQQHWYNDANNTITGKIINGTAYNGWGKPHIFTKPVYSENSSLEYQPNFIDYNYDTGLMQGSFVSLFNKAKNNSNNSYLITDQLKTELLFNQNFYSNDPLQRLINTTQPGLNNKDKENTQVVEYQGFDGFNLLAKTGAVNQRRQAFATKTTKIRNNTTTNVKDLFGRNTLKQTGKEANNEASLTSKAYLFDNNGNSYSERRLPLSHKNNTPDLYKNSHVNQDLLGDHFFTKTVDENTRYVIKNKKGLPVFSSTENFDPTKTNIKWNYIHYDLIDRPIEAGIITVPGEFNRNQMNLLANTPVFFRNLGKDILKQWKYDNQENTLNNQYTLGKVVQNLRFINNQNIEHKYTYNQRGQILTKATYINNVVQGIIKYTYQNDGKIKTITYPNNTVVKYSYDLNGRLYGIGTNTNNFAYAKYNYGTNGKMIECDLGNGILKSTQNYTLQEHKNEFKVNLLNLNNTLFSESFKYTNDNGAYFNGMILAKEEKLEGQPLTQFKYTYDSQYRLTNVNRNVVNQERNYKFDYDVNGNFKDILTPSTRLLGGITIKNNTNKFISFNDVSHKIDFLSNDIGLYTSIQTQSSFSGKNTKQLKYDELTRKVIKINQSLGNKQSTFNYNADDQRVQKIRTYTNDNTKVDDQLNYIFGTYNLPLYEKYTDKITNNQWDKVYIFGKQYAPIAMLHKGKTYYFVRDYQSSLKNVVQADTQKVVETYQYSPYGEIEYANTIGTQEGYNLGTYLYTGQEYDSSTGLYNFKARLYNPQLKIFLQPDPKHINYSPYTYTNNNPINFVDKDGKAPIYTDPPLRMSIYGFNKDIQNEIYTPLANLDEYELGVNSEGLVNFKKSGKLFHTKIPSSIIQIEDITKFTMDADGRIYAFPSYIEGQGEIVHPQGAYESPVAAGEIQATEGRIVKINEESGHFLPNNRSHLVDQELRTRNAKFSENYELVKNTRPPVADSERVIFNDLNETRSVIKKEVEKLATPPPLPPRRLKPKFK